MAYSEDHIALAAEYALGTLDAAERAQVETMMAADHDFAAMVTAWEQKLGVLNEMVGSVEPRLEVWEKIRAAAGLTGMPATLAETASPMVARPTSPVATGDSSNVIRLNDRAGPWRGVATLMTAVAAALVAMIAVQVYRPDLLPDPLRPAPRTEVAKTPAPAGAQYVAVLQKDGGPPAFILTVDGTTKEYTARRVGAPAEPGKSFELWLISDSLPQPRSIGVIGASDFTVRPELASFDPATIKAGTYAVTIEQAGGSPDGKPTSAPVFAGKLIETVPAGATPAPPR
jgi:anti-sigma-K factor RskA